MNRRDRRAASRQNTSAARIKELERRVEATGKPGIIYGLTDACRDCNAYGQIILVPGNRMIDRIFHEDGCPVLAGVVKWEPVP